MFPDNHTCHPDVTDGRRAFLMGNALVCGIIQQVGKSLYRFIYDKDKQARTLQVDGVQRLSTKEEFQMR